MSELVKTDSDYKAILDKFESTYKSIEAANLKRYHALGELFSEFCVGQDKRKYGTRTVDTLATDLVNRGILTDIADPKRLLYWAKLVYDKYTDFAVLEDLAKKGFSVSHAKHLLSVPPELMPEVEAKLFVKDRCISVRDLGDLINTLRTKSVVTKAKDALESAKSLEKAKEELAEGEVRVEIVDSSGDDPAETEPAEPAEETKPLETPKPLSRPVDATPARAEADIPHPLKTINSIDSILTKACAEIPDLLIVIKEIDKRGFDSDKAQKNFEEAKRNVRATMESLIPIMEAMLVELAD
jgi:predicted transcriptional regulator